MDLNKLKFTKLEEDIIEFLFRNPTTTFNGKELAIKLKVSQTAINKSVRRLTKIELLELKKNVLLSIRLNREDKDIFNLKKIFNLKEIYSSRIIEYLSEEFPSSTIILFGSYSNGYDTEESDIDICLIGYNQKSLNLKVFEKRLQRNVQVHFFKDINHADKNLKENLINGIVLAGAITL